MNWSSKTILRLFKYHVAPNKTHKTIYIQHSIYDVQYLYICMHYFDFFIRVAYSKKCTLVYDLKYFCIQTINSPHFAFHTLVGSPCYASALLSTHATPTHNVVSLQQATCIILYSNRNAS